MRGACLVAREKPAKKVSNEPPQEGQSDGGKFDATIKLRKQFKERLESVAKDLGLFPGELIEDKLKQFVTQEWVRVARKNEEKAKRDREQAEQEARQSGK